MEFTTLKRFVAASLCAAAIFSSSEAFAQASEPAPTFFQSFGSTAIGPGSTTTTTFTLTNNSATPLTEVEFNHVFTSTPGALQLVPGLGQTDCTGAIDIFAANNFAFYDGFLGGNETCTISFNVTASTPGAYTDTATTLTTLESASATLSPASITVEAARPVFSKSISPNDINPGETATITYTIDNSAGGSVVSNMTFSETLPTGVIVASPSNASSNCSASFYTGGVFSPVSGSNSISLASGGGLNVAAVDSASTCTLTVDVVGSAIGLYELSSSSLAYLNGFTPGTTGLSTALFNVEVDAPDDAPILSKSFTDDPVSAGALATLEFTIQNRERNFSATSVAFTDDLNSMLAGATFESLLGNTCGGAITGVGSASLGLSGGTIAAASDCKISASIRIPGAAAAGEYTNTTSDITAVVNSVAVTGNTATAPLFVRSASTPSFTKSFIDDPVASGGAVTIRYEITNNDGAQALTGVNFTDNLSDFVGNTAQLVPGTPPANCGGSAVFASYTPSISSAGILFSSGEIPAGATCTLDVVMTLNDGLASGNYASTTDELSGQIGGTAVSAGTASDTLVVNAGGVSLSMSKSFDADSVLPGGTVNVTFEIGSGAESAADADALTFFDDLFASGNDFPTGTTFQGTPTNSCGGSVALENSNSLLRLTGGSISPNSTCTVSAAISIPATAGTAVYNNTTSELTGTSGGNPVSAPAATDELTIVGFDPSGITRSFVPNSVVPGETFLVRYTYANSSALPVTIGANLDVLVNLLSGLTLNPTPVTDTCSIAPSISTFVLFASGTIPANGQCIIEVEATVPAGSTPGTYGQGMSVASVGGLDFAPLTATLTVESITPELSKSFTDPDIEPGGSSSITFSMANTSDRAMSDISFTDNLDAMLSGTIIDSVSDTCGGTPTGTGSGSFAYSGGSLAASSSCTATVNFTIPVDALPGSYSNTTSAITAVVGGIGYSGIAATSNLTVTSPGAPTFSKSFSGPAAPGSTTTLSFSITNTDASSSINNLRFSDDLSAVISGLTATVLPSTPCGAGSTLTGTSTLVLDGANLAASATCNFDVTLQVPASATAGDYTNTTSALFRSGVALASPASATLSIVPPPAFSMAYATPSIAQGGTSNLVLTIDNTSGVLPANALDFTFTLPANTTLSTPSAAATTCTGGTLTALNGGNTIAYTGGTVAAGATCTVSANVTSVTTGSYPSTTGDLTSSLGNSGTANATLAVTAAPVPAFTKAYASSTLEQGATTTLTFTINNTALIAANTLDFTDNMPTGSVVAAVPNASSTCTGGTLTAVAGTGVISYTGGSLAASSQCQIAVDVYGNAPLSATNTTGDLTSSLGNSGQATAGLSVTAAPTPGFSKVFAPDTVVQGANSRLTFTINNTSLLPANSLSFTDTLPAGMIVAEAGSNVSADCGGTVTAVASSGSISLSGGTLAAGTSCTIAIDVQTTGSGAMLNTSSALGSSLGAGGTASDTLNVTPAPIPSLTAAFSPAAVAVGGTSRLTLTLSNATALLAASDLEMTSALPTGLELANPVNLSANCTGIAVTAATGTTALDTDGGSVDAGATCTIAVDVVSTGSGALGYAPAIATSLGTTPTASATLNVNPSPVPVFSKSFSPSTIDQGGTSTLTFQIDNTAAFLAATALAFDDDMPVGMRVAPTPNVATTCGAGVLTAPAGDDEISFNGGTVAAGTSCTVQLDVVAETSGVLNNSSERLTSSAGTSGEASATLRVNPAPSPMFSKAFAPASVTLGDESTLTFTISNPATLVSSTGIAFTDPLPAGMTIANDSTNATTTCSGGSVTAALGGSSVSFSGGSLAPGASCTISVDVVSTANGALVNTSGLLSSSSGQAGPAIATLSVGGADVPSFSKSFSPSTIPFGGTSTLTFEMRNTAAVDATNAAFTDTLPTGVTVAATPNVTSNCASGSVIASGSSISLASGTLSARSSCTISVDVVGANAGTAINTSGALTSSLGNSGGANASLQIETPVVPLISKTFAPSTINVGETAAMTINIDNSGSLADAASMLLIDNLPTGVVVSGTPSTTCSVGGSFTSTATQIQLTSGTVPSSSSCQINATVQGVAAGNFTNVTNRVTSSLGNSGSASATLTVNAAPTPGFSKSFSPSSVAQGAESTLTFTIDNSASAVAITGLAFTNNLPSGITIATDSANASTTCSGGSISAATGSSVISYSGGSVPAGATCTLSVDILAAGGTSVTNTTSNLSTDIGNSGVASASLSISAAPAPAFSKVFSPNTVDQGVETTLTFTIDNSASLVDATSLDFTDSLPEGITVATDSANASTTCTGGTLTAATGSDTISYSGGTVGAGAVCTISVDILAAGSNNVTNTTGNLTSSLGDSGTASANLSINGATPPAFTKVFAPDNIAQGDSTVMTLTFDNGANFIDATAVSITDNFPAGMQVAATPSASTTCIGGTLTATGGASTVTYSGGTIPAGSSCEVSVVITATASGNLTNTTEALTTSIGNSGTATDVLSVTAAPVLAFTAAFDPASIGQGGTTTLTLTLDNVGRFVDATAAAVSGTLPAGISFAASPNLSNTCTGTATASGSTLSLSGGSVAANTSCEVSVDVTSTTIASHAFNTGDLTSSLGNSGPANAALTVTTAPTPEISYAFAPTTIEQFEISTLTLNIDNSGAFIGFSPLTFDYAFPAGLQIAPDPNVTSTCTGISTTATAGGTSIATSGGSLAALSSCEVTVDVTSSTISVIDASAGTLSGWAGREATGSVTLTVLEATTGTITIVQNADVDDTFRYTSATRGLNFSIATTAGTGQFGPYTIPAGSYQIAQQRPSGSGNTSLVCSDDDSGTDAETGVINIELGVRENLVCTFVSINTRQKTVDTINEFLSRRADLILANEPSNGRRIGRLNKDYDTATRASFNDGDLKALNPFEFDLTTIGSGNYSFATSLAAIENSVSQAGLVFGGDAGGGTWIENRRWDIWAEGIWQRFEGGTASSGHFGMLSLGADYVLDRNTLVGAMLQIDDMDNTDSSANSSTKGTGWLVGPYLTKRLSETLYFDGRVAYGQSRNTVSPFGTYADDFDGERWLARAQITGDFDRGNWTIQPNASLAYFQEMQRSYTDSVGVVIPSQTVALGQFSFGPTIKGNFAASGGLAYQPVFALDAIYNFGDTWGTTVTNPNAPQTQGWRGRLKAGVNFTTAGGATFNFSGTYDGIGRSDFEAWGLSFDINIPIGSGPAR
ncbi:putative repeat protein (TIGR01451 family) [Shimia isoporae]|uniref:Putative repeat protein (TIGR01451 family) n=1 Tax=Shimia isoporae TaxID=647720 RepID=A0A4R1N035_9RHOB|nr:autotransporter domain-containing protein [Shimia isoporae]TCK98926.1 putative repeat protein (TIGR01451 family) [Shimia isoporae]